MRNLYCVFDYPWENVTSKGGVCNEYKIDLLNYIVKGMRVRAVGIIGVRCEYGGERHAKFSVPSLAPRKLSLSQRWDDRQDSCRTYAPLPHTTKPDLRGKVFLNI